MATSTLFDFLDALETGLEGVVPSGTSVYTVPNSDGGSATADFIEVTNIELDQDYMAMGGGRLEQYTVEGRVIVKRQANSEAASKEARERVEAIVDTIETYLRNNKTVGGTVLAAAFTGLRLTQGWGNKDRQGRACQCDFTITIRAAI